MPRGVRSKSGVERRSDLVLERTDVPADGRLGHVEPLRRTAHVTFLGHRDEVANLRQAHRNSVPAASPDGKARPGAARPDRNGIGRSVPASRMHERWRSRS
jgi:hypothetical protein